MILGTGTERKVDNATVGAAPDLHGCYDFWLSPQTLSISTGALILLQLSLAAAHLSRFNARARGVDAGCDHLREFENDKAIFIS